MGVGLCFDRVVGGAVGKGVGARRFGHKTWAFPWIFRPRIRGFLGGVVLHERSICLFLVGRSRKQSRAIGYTMATAPSAKTKKSCCASHLRWVLRSVQDAPGWCLTQVGKAQADYADHGEAIGSISEDFLGPGWPASLKYDPF